jgi:hypothetical protein
LDSARETQPSSRRARCAAIINSAKPVVAMAPPVLEGETTVN